MKKKMIFISYFFPRKPQSYTLQDLLCEVGVQSNIIIICIAYVHSSLDIYIIFRLFCLHNVSIVLFPLIRLVR